MNDKNSVNSDDQIQDINRVNSGVANDVNTDDKAERDEINKMILEAVEDIETVVNGKESGKDLNEIHVTSIYGNSLEIPANQSMDPSLENDEVNHSIDAHTFNNQIASLSGLRNDQGMTDNRFSQDAHVPVPQISSSLFTNLSNSSWIKSGTWKTDETNLKHQLRELLEQQTRSCRSCTCLRSVGIDTVICLDTSQSMEGLPLENAKSAIIQFINGLEQNALDYDLEENVAVVVFGNENKILCHLTNDYGDIIDKIAQITAGGPSPLWVGLALALTEIKERGKIIIVGESHILPRIILLTDGYPTPQCVLYGEDDYIHDVEETKQDILKCLEKCRQFTRTIDCIQVGQSDQTMLHKLAGDTGGRIYCTDDVPYLTQFFRIQDLANDYSTRISSGEIIVDDVVQMLKKTDLTERAQVEIIELLKGDKSIRTTIQEEKSDERRLENQDNANVQNDNVTVDPNPETNNDSIVGHEQRNEEHKNKDQESTIPEIKEPEFGESVVATETCADYQELKNMAGTVIGPLKQGMVKIVWSDGTIGKYRYGQDEKYDVKIVPALGYGLTDVRIGAIVERGPDWKWKDQDGGAGTIGVLTSFTDTIAVVIWSHGGQGNYRYGYSKKYDIKLYDNRTRSNSLGYVYL
ncbi:zinc ion binding [Mactra antiquata]